jgi:hypothetical protein
MTDNGAVQQPPTTRISATITDEHRRMLEALGALWRFKTSRAVEEAIEIAYHRRS